MIRQTDALPDEVRTKAILLRFILSLRAPYPVPTFVVHPQNGFTALHMAANRQVYDIRSREAINLLLARFDKPEQINCHAHAADDWSPVPLELAIATQNAVAVKALIDAGADICIRFPSNRTTIQEARHIVRYLLEQEGNSPCKVQRERLDRALEIITILAEAISEPDEDTWRLSIMNLVEELEPLKNQMLRLTHAQARLLGFNTEYDQMIRKHITNLPTYQGEIEELHMQLERAVQPLFFTELTIQIYHDAFDMTNTSLLSQVNQVQVRLPVFASLPIVYLEELQQAAAFEFVLEHIRAIVSLQDAAGVSLDFEHKLPIDSLSRFAHSGNRRHLPHEERLIQYPTTLLTAYARAITDGKLILDPSSPSTLQIERFLELLRSRASALGSGQLPLPPLTEEFSYFHFEQLQIFLLDPNKLLFPLRSNWKCRCYRYSAGCLNKLVFSFLA